MSQIIITGGTGQIGKQLSNLLINKGYDVALLSRDPGKNKNSEIQEYHWDLDKCEIDQNAINSCDHIIHLAGTNIGEKRWTRERKKQIVESRTKSANLIFDNLNKNNNRLKTFISASAIGYYGSITSDHVYVETDTPAMDFLGKTCKHWEDSADKFDSLGIRVVKIRTGIVLSPDGGALSRFVLPAKIGLGSGIGSGEQFMPWIHIDDLCNLYLRAIENDDMEGPYNAVAPEHITSNEFARKVSATLNKPFWLPKIPAIILKIMFGEMSGMLLNGSRVSSEKIITSGYNFKFPSINNTLESLIKKNK